MYDRLVHFSFGFLLAYPMREVFLRLSKVRDSGLLPAPGRDPLVFGAVRNHRVADRAQRRPASGLAFLGAQGDIWDAQKDMTVAGIGALLAMTVIAVINWKLNPDFTREFRSSFRIAKGDRPLGEQRLQEWLRRRRSRA